MYVNFQNNTITRAARSTRLLLLQVLAGVGCIPPFLYSVERLFLWLEPMMPKSQENNITTVPRPALINNSNEQFTSSYKEISFHKQTPFPFCSSEEEGEDDSGRELQLHSPVAPNQLRLQNGNGSLPGKARIAGTQQCILDEITPTVLAKNPDDNIPSFTKVAKGLHEKIKN